MEKESETTIQEDAQNSGTPAEPSSAKPSGKKTAVHEQRIPAEGYHRRIGASCARRGTTQSCRSASSGGRLAAEAAAVEAALAEERSKAAQAQKALAERRPTVEKPTEVAEQATESVGGQATAFGLTPFVGLQGADIFNVGQQVFQQAIKQQPLAMKTYTNYLLELGRIWSW